MLRLIQGGEVYDPEPRGKQDVLLLNDRIVKVASDIRVPPDFMETEVVDARGKIVAPGFIDYHNHFLGGGGGSGFASRVPELPFSRLVAAGITTVVGCLGMDCATRSMASLLGKAHSLEAEGLTTFVYTGATYEHPVPTLTGSIRNDIIFVDKVIGVGEVSLSELGPQYDSFGSGAQYIAMIAAQSMNAARIAGKAGLICLQVPGSGRGLEPLFDILGKTNLPIRYFIPAHINQNQKYFEQGIQFAKMGGIADVTSAYSPNRGFSKAIKPSTAVRLLLESGVGIEHITMSTDGNGAHPHGEFLGRPVSSTYLTVNSLQEEFKDLVLQEKIPLEDSLRVFTSNVARALYLPHRKGTIRGGADADLLVFTPDLSLDKVLAKGRVVVNDGKVVVTGTYESVSA